MLAAGAWETLGNDFADLLDFGRLVDVMVRLLAAALLGGMLGFQREKTGKAAGFRTHMLVAIGAAFFVIVPQLEGTPKADMSRVVQGVVAGIGFLGAGAILKRTDAGEIHGLTTAANIWLTASIGIAAGFGRLGLAILTTLLAFAILEFLHRVETRIAKQQPGEKNETKEAGEKRGGDKEGG